ncbi:MAG: RMD1 family protein [Campylobacterales bacterium]
MNLLSLNLPNTQKPNGWNRFPMGGYYRPCAEGWLFFSRFSTLTIATTRNITDELLRQIQQELDLEVDLVSTKQNGIWQDLSVTIAPLSGGRGWAIEQGTLILPSAELYPIGVVAHALAQSTALEAIEISVGEIMNEGELLQKGLRKIPWRRDPFIRFIARALRLRHEATASLSLLDKPDFLWESEQLDHLYDGVASWLELKERFKVIDYKLSRLSETIETVVTAIDQSRMETLEWTIIVLIGIEIVVMVADVLKG